MATSSVKSKKQSKRKEQEISTSMGLGYTDPPAILNLYQSFFENRSPNDLWKADFSREHFSLSFFLQKQKTLIIHSQTLPQVPVEATAIK